MELSIVLVIIGLIVGGILTGKDLIHAAENRAFVSQLQGYNAAVNTFKTKYNCLPGDCANATDYFTGATNGNGNGMVSGLVTEGGWSSADYTIDSSAGLISTYLGCCYTTEAQYFWKHLQSALLISPNSITIQDTSDSWSTSLPAAKNDGTGIVATGWAGKHYYHSGATSAGVTGNVYYSLNFSPADADYIFQKIGGTTITTTHSNPSSISPDGLGTDRIIVSNVSNRFFWRFPTQGAGGSTAPYCIDTSVTPAYFNVKNPSKLCALIIQADF